jgi:hypothetical protein
MARNPGCKICGTHSHKTSNCPKKPKRIKKRKSSKCSTAGWGENVTI